MKWINNTKESLKAIKNAATLHFKVVILFFRKVAPRRRFVSAASDECPIG